MTLQRQEDRMIVKVWTTGLINYIPLSIYIDMPLPFPCSLNYHLQDSIWCSAAWREEMSVGAHLLVASNYYLHCSLLQKTEFGLFFCCMFYRLLQRGNKCWGPSSSSSRLTPPSHYYLLQPGGSHSTSRQEGIPPSPSSKPHHQLFGNILDEQVTACPVGFCADMTRVLDQVSLAI